MTRKYLWFLFLIYGVLLGVSAQTPCMECHNDKSLSTRKKGKDVPLFVEIHQLEKSVHGKLPCGSCHVGFDPDDIPHAKKIEPINCASCHNKDLLKHNFHPNIIVTKGSGWTADANCKGCHGTHNVESPKKEGAHFNRANLVNACGECHKDVKNDFIHSAHGLAQKEHDEKAPVCLSCHQNNIVSVRPGTDSLQLKVSQAKMCMSCHLDNHVAEKTLLGAKFVQSYENSIHGTALLKNHNHRAANCVDCHGSHQMNKSIVDSSLVNKLNIPKTCSKCHPDQAHDYLSSVHAGAVKKGNQDAPGCTDCHGEHDILKHDNPNSPVSARNVSKQLCGTCHSSVKLSAKYGISSDRFQTFSDSYHGLSVRGGALEVINCASCHGPHAIKRPSDSTSSVSKAGIVKTCGKCHPGANSRFAVGSVHSSDTSKAEDPALYWIATIYTIGIILIIGGMLLHNAIVFMKKINQKLMQHRGQVPSETTYGHGIYLRMTMSERIQHGVLGLSFILLVITGFMLRYPEAWWVKGLRFLSDSAFEWRGIIHRVSGVVLILSGVYHIAYVMFTVRGRQLIKDLWFKRTDWKEAIGVMKFNLGFAKTKPKLGRFCYVEKIEYWALIWGSVVMGITGIIMWFETQSMGILTKLGWDIARTIHFYEAILATLAIFVWHFYFVIFNPDIYPMNLSWITGHLSEREMEEEHPSELEEIRRLEAAKTEAKEPKQE